MKGTITITRPLLVSFSGLPATGKSTLSGALATARRAVYLRIDVIENAMRQSGSLRGDVGPSGYLVAYALAEANLRLGLDVVADCVNPVALTRDAWAALAARAGATITEVEVICSDRAEHRHRAETRDPGIPGHRSPGWDEIESSDYAPWTRDRIVIDTAGKSIEAALAELEKSLSASPR